MKKILIILGTRPEAIKLAPLINSLRQTKSLKTVVCLSGQHEHIARPMLAHFGIKPDIVFDVPRSYGDLTQLASSVISELGKVLTRIKPTLIVVQGDTTTALLGALAAYYCGIPYAHVEAGLRSGDLDNPYPEEFNRRAISIAGTLHFCPTKVSKANLLKEKIPTGRVHVTGNTCIDALFWTLKNSAPKTMFQADKRGILVTSHRRENWKQGISATCQALKQALDRYDDLDILFPVHPNPIVQKIVRKQLGHSPQVRLVEPLGYADFCHAMHQAWCIVTDSGGVQEEALALGIPTLVTRKVTERPEVLKGGTVRLAGESGKNLSRLLNRVLASKHARNKMAVPLFPFGRGDSAGHITDIITKYLAGL